MLTMVLGVGKPNILNAAAICFKGLMVKVSGAFSAGRRKKLSNACSTVLSASLICVTTALTVSLSSSPALSFSNL